MKKCEKVDCTFIISLIAIAISTISIIFSIFSKEVDANWIAIFCGLLTVLLAIIVYFNLSQTKKTAEEAARNTAEEVAKEKAEEIARQITIEEIEKITAENKVIQIVQSKLSELTAESIKDFVNEDYKMLVCDLYKKQLHKLYNRKAMEPELKTYNDIMEYIRKNNPNNEC